VLVKSAPEFLYEAAGLLAATVMWKRAFGRGITGVPVNAICKVPRR